MDPPSGDDGQSPVTTTSPKPDRIGGAEAPGSGIDRDRLYTDSNASFAAHCQSFLVVIAAASAIGVAIQWTVTKTPRRSPGRRQYSAKH
jgi:hypothetical protein